MKRITIRFLTLTGETAYHKVCEEGEKNPWHDRQVAKSVAKDKVVQKSPLVVEIKVKIPWLGEKTQLDHQIVLGLQKHGAEKDKDYTLEVIR